MIEQFVDAVMDDLRGATADEDWLLLDDWLADDIDLAKRGRLRKSDELSDGQRQQIRSLALAIAQRQGHRTRKRGSRRQVHQRGITRRANNIERSALRMIDSCQSYEQVIAYLQRRLNN